MLNLYLAPRKGGFDVDVALAFLEDNGFIGPAGADGDHPPGPDVAFLFNDDAHDDLLPAELTFHSVAGVTRRRAAFLPLHQPVEDFEGARCTLCGDVIDVEGLRQAFAEVAYRPIDRFEYLCPSCRTPLSLSQIDFEQPIALASAWIYVEGAGTSRLAAKVLDALGKAVGASLVVVPEVPDEDPTEWSPALRRRRW